MNDVRRGSVAAATLKTIHQQKTGQLKVMERAVTTAHSNQAGHLSAQKIHLNFQLDFVLTLNETHNLDNEHK